MQTASGHLNLHACTHRRYALSSMCHNILMMLWLHSWLYSGKDWLYREGWQVSGEKGWHRRRQVRTNYLDWHIWPVVPNPITHLTVLSSPDQALVSPSRDSSHCLKSTCTNPFCPNLPINVGTAEDENTFLQHLSRCDLSPPSCSSSSTGHRGSTVYVLLLQSLPVFSLVKRGWSRHQLVDQWEDSLGPLLRLGSAWTRETRQEVRKITAWWILTEPDF